MCTTRFLLPTAREGNVFGSVSYFVYSGDGDLHPEGSASGRSASRGWGPAAKRGGLHPRDGGLHPRKSASGELDRAPLDLPQEGGGLGRPFGSDI